MAKEIYIIDTNALVALADRTKRDDVVVIFDDLTKHGKLVSVSKVFEELDRRFKAVSNLFKKYKNLMMVDHRNDSDILDWNDHIFRNFPKLYDRYSSHDPADPWLIAVAKTRGFVVVTDESSNPKRQDKIPYVCEALQVPCISSSEFLKRNSQ